MATRSLEMATRSLEEVVLNRVGYFVSRHAADERASAQLAAAMPPSPDLWRLQELRRAYAAFGCNAQIHSQWDQNVTAALDLHHFRAESAYMWEQRDGNVPVTYLATYYYHRLSHHAGLLQRCTEDGHFGAYCLEIDGALVSRDQLDSVAELGYLAEVFQLSAGSGLRILDIGSGYGRLGWRVHQCFPQAEMLCVDAVPESAFLCERYLAARATGPTVRMVPLTEIAAELQRRTVDVAIAVNSLSECTAAAIEWWIELLEDAKVPYLLLIPHAAHDGGRTILSVEDAGLPPTPAASLLAKHGYVLRDLRPKYLEPAVQLYGVSPTYFHLYGRA